MSLNILVFGFAFGSSFAALGLLTYFALSTISRFGEWLLSSFIQTVQEHEVMFVYNKLGKRQYQILRTGRYIRVWWLYKIEDICSETLWVAVNVYEKRDLYQLNLRLQATFEYSDERKGSFLILVPIQNQMILLFKPLLLEPDLEVMITPRVLNGAPFDMLSTYAEQFGLKLKKVEMLGAETVKPLVVQS